MSVDSALLVATLLPESILGARWFAVLSTFVAINTILYVSISVFSILPKVYLSDVVRRYGRRSETRSTYPNGESPPLPEPSTGDREPTGDAIPEWASARRPVSRVVGTQATTPPESHGTRGSRRTGSPGHPRHRPSHRIPTTPPG